MEISKQIAQGRVKVTPDFLVPGGDNPGGLLSAFRTDIISKSVRVPVIPSGGEEPEKS
jgi:hypothetical protein